MNKIQKSGVNKKMTKNKIHKAKKKQATKKIMDKVREIKPKN